MTSVQAGSTTAVIHLVRAANGLGPFASFLRSLQSHDSGRAYDLVLVFKGFADDVLPPEYERLLAAVAHERLFTSDEGFDIGAYFFAARRVAHETVCCLNSFSRILHPNWLGFFEEALRAPRIGIVGATGSAESARGARRDRGILRAAWRALSPRTWYRVAAFPPFPNHHVRTNAFCLSRRHFLSLHTGSLMSKRDLYRFESGRRSMTRQLAARGLEARIVGRDGVAYPPHVWASSGTFRSGEQENLLVADNRTTEYAAADSERRRMLAEAAWGRVITSARESWAEERRTSVP